MNSASQINPVVDVAIVGAGMVGIPLATMLAQQDISVVLLDKEPRESNAAEGSRGFTALSHATVQILKEHHLWTAAAADACAISEVHVSHKGYFGGSHIAAKQQNVDALGHVVDNRHFLRSVRSVLAQSPVNVIQEATVKQVEYARNAAEVHYTVSNNPQKLRTRLLIAVDGVSSTIRQAAGIQTTQVDYDQVGVLGTVELNQAHNHVAYERFTPSGPLAMLPRPRNTMSYVYCVDPVQQSDIASMSDAEWLGVLQDAFGYRLGRFKSTGARLTLPLVRIEATQASAPRLLLMGNALRLLHPVAGQGYNLAMRDAHGLCTRLSTLPDDPGSATFLSSFVESRDQDHRRVVSLTDTLARTFRGHASLPAHARALGLLGLDRITPLRDEFTLRSMGYSG